MALIELDLATRPEVVPAAPPAHRYRITGLLVALLLVIAAGAGVPAVPRLWQELGAVPLAGADTQFLLAGDRVVTLDVQEAARVVAAVTIGADPRVLWTTMLPTGQSGATPAARIEAARVGDLTLLDDGWTTTALDSASGRLRWSLPGTLIPVPGTRLALIQEPEFRAGTVYDEASGAAGPLYFTAGGEAHNEPPLRTVIRAVDLDTGRPSWSATAPGAVNVFGTSGAGPAVLIVSSDRLERRDAATGRVLATASLSGMGPGRPVGSSLIGGALLVYYGEVEGTEVAYDPVGLTRRWVRDLPDSVIAPPVCGEVLCGGGRSDLDVLDPVTGSARWRAPSDVDLSLRDGYVVETDTDSGQLRRVVDPDTGATRVDLSAWSAAPIRSRSAPLVMQRQDADGSLVFGVVVARHDVLQPLGRVQRPADDCVADDEHVACRGANGALRVWAYRS